MDCLNCGNRVHGRFCHHCGQEKFMRRLVSMNEEYQGNLVVFFGHLVNRFIHSFPTILFISLPLPAFLQKLNYIRHRSILVANRGIFLVHLYIFIFIWMAIYFSLRGLSGLLNFNWFFIFGIALFGWLFIYIYQAVRNFYQQGKVKTGLHGSFSWAQVC